MSDRQSPNCPECHDSVDRRDFLRVIRGAATLAVGGALSTAVPRSLFGAEPPAAAPPMPKAPRPAEGLCKELFGTLTADQKRQVLSPWNKPNRLPLLQRSDERSARPGLCTQPQRELLDRIMKSMSSGDDGYVKLSRRGGWDTGGGFGGCARTSSATRRPTVQQWAFVFSRTSSSPSVATAIPSPMPRGADGRSTTATPPTELSRRNVFNFQTQAVNTVYDSLNEAQRRTAVISRGTPGEGVNSVAFHRDNFPGG